MKKERGVNGCETPSRYPEGVALRLDWGKRNGLFINLFSSSISFSS